MRKGGLSKVIQNHCFFGNSSHLPHARTRTTTATMRTQVLPTDPLFVRDLRNDDVDEKGLECGRAFEKQLARFRTQTISFQPVCSKRDFRDIIELMFD